MEKKQCTSSAWDAEDVAHVCHVCGKHVAEWHVRACNCCGFSHKRCHAFAVGMSLWCQKWALTRRPRANLGPRATCFWTAGSSTSTWTKSLAAVLIRRGKCSLGAAGGPLQHAVRAGDEVAIPDVELVGQVRALEVGVCRRILQKDFLARARRCCDRP